MTPPNDAPATVEQFVAKIMDERAAYFDRTTGHFDREDAARSYRATKAELMKGLAALASAPAGDAPCEHESWEVDGAGRRTYCVDCREYLGPVPADQVADAGKPIVPVGDGQDYEIAWRALSEPLSWMHDSPHLKGRWGENLAQIANDLIREAHPDWDIPGTSAKIEPCTCERARARGTTMMCLICDKGKR